MTRGPCVAHVAYSNSGQPQPQLRGVPTTTTKPGAGRGCGGGGRVSPQAPMPIACLLACMLACLHACMLACLYACMLACLHACLRACVPACLRACVPACLRACVPACLRACMHAHVYMRNVYREVDSWIDRWIDRFGQEVHQAPALSSTALSGGGICVLQYLIRSFESPKLKTVSLVTSSRSGDNSSRRSWPCGSSS